MYRTVQQPSRIHKPMVHEGEFQAEVLAVLCVTGIFGYIGRIGTFLQNYIDAAAPGTVQHAGEG